MARQNTIHETESWRVKQFRNGKLVRYTGRMNEGTARIEYESWAVAENENVELQCRRVGQHRYYPVQQRFASHPRLDW